MCLNIIRYYELHSLTKNNVSERKNKISHFL